MTFDIGANDQRVNLTDQRAFHIFNLFKKKLHKFLDWAEVDENLTYVFLVTFLRLVLKII